MQPLSGYFVVFAPLQDLDDVNSVWGDFCCCLHERAGGAPECRDCCQDCAIITSLQGSLPERCRLITALVDWLEGNPQYDDRDWWYVLSPPCPPDDLRKGPDLRQAAIEYAMSFSMFDNIIARPKDEQDFSDYYLHKALDKVLKRLTWHTARFAAESIGQQTIYWPGVHYEESIEQEEWLKLPEWKCFRELARFSMQHAVYHFPLTAWQPYRPFLEYAVPKPYSQLKKELRQLSPAECPHRLATALLAASGHERS